MPDVIELTLNREPSCGSRAREALRMHFADHLSGEKFDDARTVLSELVSNAYVHGRGSIALKLQLRDGRLRIEVIDEGHGEAVAVRRAGEHGGGQGLRIVHALTRAWGAFEGTTHVWAELDAR